MTTTAPRRTSSPRARIRDRGQVDAIVLAALAEAPLRQEQVADVVRRQVGDALDFPYSRIVPTLHRLARNRLVVRSSRDPRRYRLTEVGTRSLSARRRAADAFATSLHRLAEGEDGDAAPGAERRAPSRG